MVVDENIENEELRNHIYSTLPKFQTQEALNALTKNDPKIISQYSFLPGYYSSIKLFSLKLLSVFQFNIAFTKDNFKEGLDLVKALQADNMNSVYYQS